jgi:hypothetical protein
MVHHASTPTKGWPFLTITTRFHLCRQATLARVLKPAHSLRLSLRRPRRLSRTVVATPLLSDLRPRGPANLSLRASLRQVLRLCPRELHLKSRCNSSSRKSLQRYRPPCVAITIAADRSQSRALRHGLGYYRPIKTHGLMHSAGNAGASQCRIGGHLSNVYAGSCISRRGSILYRLS